MTHSRLRTTQVEYVDGILAKVCSRCKILKKLTEYYFNPKNQFGLAVECKTCHLDLTRRWEKDNKENRRGRSIEKYGITSEEYIEKVELQLGGCAICKQPCKSGLRLSIDHDHITGQIRGLLCKSCNSILGYCNEDEEILINVIEYLKKYQKII